ncbi:hypothetical protein [Propionicicella superfundia]|uniref:hypothetical protein n=1 Tax=Propionicicella superfundia TaxID=348582 RepID=UPI000400E319|nr:hypothetical protein [Propionicicella superfundia]
MIEIDWSAFARVFGAALTGAVLVVFFYAFGLRMLVRAGRVPRITSAELTDAIMIVSKKDIRRAEKAKAKAAKRPPTTRTQRRVAFAVAITSFVLCATAIAGGLFLIVAGR